MDDNNSSVLGDFYQQQSGKVLLGHTERIQKCEKLNVMFVASQIMAECITVIMMLTLQVMNKKCGRRTHSTGLYTYAHSFLLMCYIQYEMMKP